MLNMETMRAIGMIVARQARAIAADTATPANDVIDMTTLLKPWKEGPQAAGEVVVHNGYPYRVLQAHDSTGNPGWNPENTPALFAPYHGTDKAHALPWRAPTHAGDAYQAGEYMVWTDGVIYKCLQNGTVWDPQVLPSAWEVA